MKFNISEIFYSIQGEGPNCGMPAVFLRFSGCNLRCKWGENLCDTPYTSWEPETNLITTEEILERVGAVCKGCNHLIITGGEPTLNDGLDELFVFLKRRGFKLDLETNGTGAISRFIDLVVCSPKLSDSAPHGSKYFLMHEKARVKLSHDIVGSDSRIFLKFVISNSTRMEEITEIVNRTKVPPERVYLMPEGIVREQIIDNSVHVWNLCLENGFRFSSRLHVLLWGNERGK